jgi:hypothetical protein
VSGIEAAANMRGVPLQVADVDNAEAADLYQRRLVLVRPDGHVAWRGNAAPSDALALIDRICGAHTSPEGPPKGEVDHRRQAGDDRVGSFLRVAPHPVATRPPSPLRGEG